MASITGQEDDVVQLVAGWLHDMRPDTIDHFVVPLADLVAHPAFPGTEADRTHVPGVTASVRGRHPGNRCAPARHARRANAMLTRRLPPLGPFSRTQDPAAWPWFATYANC